MLNNLSRSKQRLERGYFRRGDLLEEARDFLQSMADETDPPSANLVELIAQINREINP